MTQRIGDADAKDAYLWLNGGLPVGGGELYWFGGVSQARRRLRPASSAAPATAAPCPTSIPNGFLPNIITTVEDASLAVGYRAPLGDDWDWDVSINHGRSKFGFAGAQYGQRQLVVRADRPADPRGPSTRESPTSADTGTLEFNQTTFNLDFRGTVDWGIGNEPL